MCAFHLAMNLILCYYALGDREKMKKTFQKMLQTGLSVEDDEKYTTNGVRWDSGISEFSCSRFKHF